MECSSDNSINLIDWSSPVAQSHGVPLIPVPPMLSNIIGSIDDNNPFDAVERIVTKNEPFDVTTNDINFSLTHLSLQSTSKNESLSPHNDLLQTDDFLHHKIAQYVAQRVKNCIENASRKSEGPGLISLDATASSSTIPQDVVDGKRLENFTATSLNLGFVRSDSDGFKSGSSSGQMNFKPFPSSPLSENSVTPFFQRRRNVSLPEFSSELMRTPTLPKVCRCVCTTSVESLKINLRSKLISGYNSDEDITAEVPQWISEGSDEEYSNSDSWKQHHRESSPPIFKEPALTIPKRPTASLVKTGNISNQTQGPLKATLPMRCMTKQQSEKGVIDGKHSKSLTPKKQVDKLNKKVLKPIATSTPQSTTHSFKSSVICSSRTIRNSRRSAPSSTSLGEVLLQTKKGRISSKRSCSPDSTSGTDFKIPPSPIARCTPKQKTPAPKSNSLVTHNRSSVSDIGNRKLVSTPGPKTKLTRCSEPSNRRTKLNKENVYVM